VLVKAEMLGLEFVVIVAVVVEVAEPWKWCRVHSAHMGRRSGRGE
jgi:hypothetical protein